MNNWNGGQPNPNGYGMYNQGGYPQMGTPMPTQPQVAPPPRLMPQQVQSQSMQPTPQQMPMGVPGRWVNDLNEIKPGEVPMDGTICFFPKTDYSKIYAKVWDQNGKLQDFVFVPEVPVPSEPAPAQTDERIDKMMEELGSMREQLSKILQTVNRPYKPNKKPYHPKPTNKENKT